MANPSHMLWNNLDIFQKNCLRVIKEMFGMELKPYVAAISPPQAQEPKPKPRPRPSPGPPPNSPAKFEDVILKLKALTLPPNVRFHPLAPPSLPQDLPDTPLNLLSGYASLDLAVQPKPKPRPRPVPRPPPNSPSRYIVGILIPENPQATKVLNNPGHLSTPDATPIPSREYELDKPYGLRNHHPVPRSVQGAAPKTHLGGGVAVIRELETPTDSRSRCTSCVKGGRRPPTNTSRYIYKPLSSINSQGVFDMSGMDIACPIF